MKKLAEDLDADTDALLERWGGRPDLIIEDVFRVRDLESKEISNLDLTDYQRKFVHAFWYGDESTLAVLKGRRTGYSFIACACILLKALTLKHSFHAITGPSKSQAKDRIEDIYDLIEWSPVMAKDDLPIENRDEIKLTNGATIMAFAGNPDTSRGADSADTLFIDEMDFLEDQEESMRAFSPFTALGDSATIEISTPRHSNSLFMEDVELGSDTGRNGIISIEQPAFENPEQIEIEQSLLAQDVKPVMPYLNLKEAEKDRQRDPKGFEQEYLCKTVEDSYRFFTEDGISRAVNRGAEDYIWHPATHARNGGKMIMGVDIAVGGDDDSAIAVFEHHGSHRYLRFHTVLDTEDLRAVGLQGEPENPSDLAAYVAHLTDQMGVDRVFIDKTGAGRGFHNAIDRRIGRKAEGFAFDNKDEIARMMGDFNYALHNNQITLVPDDNDQITEQLKAIVKEKRHDTSKPRFSGKDHAPNGKDDLAMALVLGAYPPNFNAERAVEPVQRDNVSGYEEPDVKSSEGTDQEAFRAMVNGGSASGEDTQSSKSDAPFGKTPSTENSRRYTRRHSR
jgi:phage FluMu gp28-like protein